MKYYRYITFSVEFLAAITGLILYKKYKHTATKYFIWFLVYLTICDTLANYVRFIRDGFLHFLHGTVFAWNYWWSTLFWKIGAIAFFIFYYRKVLKIKRLRVVLKYVNIVFLTYAFGCIILNFDEYFMKSFTSISIIGAIIIIICTMFYFYEIVQSNSVLSVFKSIKFYISVAIFIWWLVITPLIFFEYYHFNWDLNFIFLKWQVYMFANICMYLTFTFALIYCKPEETKVLE